MWFGNIALMPDQDKSEEFFQILLLLILGLLAFISIGFMAGFSVVALFLYVLSYRVLRKKLARWDLHLLPAPQQHW